MGWAGWALVFPGPWLGPGVLGKVTLPGRGGWETPGEEAQHGGLPGETHGRPTRGRESRAGGVGQRGLPDGGTQGRWGEPVRKTGVLRFSRGFADEEVGDRPSPSVLGDWLGWGSDTRLGSGGTGNHPERRESRGEGNYRCVHGRERVCGREWVCTRCARGHEWVARVCKAFTPYAWGRACTERGH